MLGCLYLTWYSQEEDDRVSPKWAKAAVTRAPLDGRWNHARTIAEQSEVGSVAGGSEISAVRSTMAWQ